MNKLIAVAIVAGLATMTGAGTASAKMPNPDVILDIVNGAKKSQSGQVTSPGDAFYPSTPDSNRRAACEEAGGTVEGGRRDWVCVL